MVHCIRYSAQASWVDPLERPRATRGAVGHDMAATRSRTTEPKRTTRPSRAACGAKVGLMSAEWEHDSRDKCTREACTRGGPGHARLAAGLVCQTPAASHRRSHLARALLLDRPQRLVKDVCRLVLGLERG